MMLFFLLTGKHPNSKQSAVAEEWQREIARSIRMPDDAVWRSNKARVARLVSGATRMKQSDRPDIDQIVFELERIKGSIEDPNTVDTADFWAEEVLVRGFQNYEYFWDVDKLEGNIAMMRGVVIKTRALESERAVQIEAVRNPVKSEICWEFWRLGYPLSGPC